MQKCIYFAEASICTYKARQRQLADIFAIAQVLRNIQKKNTKYIMKNKEGLSLFANNPADKEMIIYLQLCLEL